MANTKIANLKGPTGAAGAQGNTGSTGAQGPSGPAGSAATVAAGTTTTLAPGANATVNNAGSTSAAVFNFGIPAGVAGATGSTGPAGPAGPAGPSTPSTDAGNLLTTGSDSLLSLPPSAIQPTITAMRLRSFNAVGNPTFEVDQRNVHGVINYAAGTVAGLVCDRWTVGKVAATGTLQIASAAVNTNLPGTNFRISQNVLSLVVTAAQATLAAGEYVQILQTVEGPQWRELSSDVTSVSLLAYCSVPLNFSVALRDSPTTQSLIKAVSIPAGVYTLVQLPNLPLWAAGGNWSQTPGAVGYYIGVGLGCGTTYQAPAADTWQAGNFLGLAGTSNFLATNGAIFRLAFVQHEPGSVCTTPIDKPFTQNLDECLRYYQKSYLYGTAPGTAQAAGCAYFYSYFGGVATSPVVTIRFPKALAKMPTIVGYSSLSGTINSVRDLTNNAERAITGVIQPGDSGFGGFTVTSPAVGPLTYNFHYTADSGW